MPVIGTLITVSSQTPNTCDSQTLRSPAITQLYGTSLSTKKRAVSVNSGTMVSVSLQLLNDTGNPIDLTDCGGSAGTVAVRIREVISCKTKDIFSIDGTVTDVEQGIVEFEVPSTVANNPGIYNAELGVHNGDDDLIFTNQFYIWINRGLFGNPKYPNAGPPTIDEVRLAIRDNAPEENLLLDDFEFDLAEMCVAAEGGVRYWNEAQPPVGVSFNTRNYAVRDKWLNYITGRMMQIAAYRFRRNHLPYQAGGLSIDDQNKFQQYDQIGMALIQDYREWVKNKKVEINCYAAMTSTGSPYGSLAYHLLNTGV